MLADVLGLLRTGPECSSPTDNRLIVDAAIEQVFFCYVIHG